MTPKYSIPKVDDQGEDATVGAFAFDTLLKKMLETSPLPLWSRNSSWLSRKGKFR
jgi:hypothetical protein